MIGTPRPAVNQPATIAPTDSDLPLIEFGGPFEPPAGDAPSATAPRRPNSGSDTTFEHLPRRANG